jgi:hypothetical protein
MEKKLLTDETPIDAAPIVIDEDRTFNDLEEDHLRYGNFTIEALSHQIDTSKSYRAMCITVEALIKHLGLRILPPDESEILDDGKEWGPYNPHYYFIEFKAFLRHYGTIIDHARQTTDDEKVIEILGFVKELAENELSFETDSLTVTELPGAIYTEKYPEKHLNEGHLIEYEEFAMATYHPINTSSKKVAQVFDRIAYTLGNERTKLELDKLKTHKDAFSRKYIRDSIYIKTTALADLIQKLSALPEKERPEFNSLSMQILWFVLSDEVPEE